MPFPCIQKNSPPLCPSLTLGDHWAILSPAGRIIYIPTHTEERLLGSVHTTLLTYRPLLCRHTLEGCLFGTYKGARCGRAAVTQMQITTSCHAAPVHAMVVSCKYMYSSAAPCRGTLKEPDLEKCLGPRTVPQNPRHRRTCTTSPSGLWGAIIWSHFNDRAARLPRPTSCWSCSNMMPLLAGCFPIPHSVPSLACLHYVPVS